MNTWPETLLAALNALDNPSTIYWTENTPRSLWAISGASVNSIKAGIDDALVEHKVNPSLHRNVFCINLGANTGVMDSTEFTTNYQYIIDAIVTKWPDAEIYLVTPWIRGYPENIVLLKSWITALVVANPGNCSLGHDETVWLEGGDNGATMTYDGVHYSTAGQAECANQWKTILGY